MDKLLQELLLSRRLTLSAALSAAVASLGGCASAPVGGQASEAAARPRDFDFLVGHWRVAHRSLRAPAAVEWQTTEGECVNEPALGGAVNVDDHTIRAASGVYQGLAIRSYDAQARQWAIWWLDTRAPHHIAAPMIGAFENGVGTFYGEETADGQSVRVRFLWTRTDTQSPRWEQSYSSDGGATWMPVWTMDFSRA